MNSANTGSVIGDAFISTASSGDLRLLKELVAKLDDGVKRSLTKIRDIHGVTALHLAAGDGNTPMCEYLIRTLMFDVNIEDEDGSTPLIYAVSFQRLETATYLLDNGASLAIINQMGSTPLHLAATSGCLAATSGCKNLVQLLISRGADIEASSDRGTPLTCAASIDSEGNKEALEILLQNHANHTPVNTISNPLIVSSRISLEYTYLLVKAGADPNIDFFGETPLHSAVAGEKDDSIKYLLKAGANPNVVNYMGLTPLEMAAMNGDVEAIMILLPVTTPIPPVQNWTIKGMMQYINSAKAKKKIYLMTKQSFDMAKSKGDEAVKRGDYWVAVNWYTRANEAGPNNATILSNRSLCYARLYRGRSALSDAEECVSWRPDWAKAHYREGVALMILKKYNEAAKSFSTALKLEPDNLEIQKALREAIEAKIAAVSI